jgi:hypothetical protein
MGAEMVCNLGEVGGFASGYTSHNLSVTGGGRTHFSALLFIVGRGDKGGVTGGEAEDGRERWNMKAALPIDMDVPNHLWRIPPWRDEVTRRYCT